MKFTRITLAVLALSTVAQAQVFPLRTTITAADHRNWHSGNPVLDEEKQLLYYTEGPWLQIYDLKNQKSLLPIRIAMGSALYLALSPDGKTLYANVRGREMGNVGPLVALDTTTWQAKNFPDQVAKALNSNIGDDDYEFIRLSPDGETLAIRYNLRWNQGNPNLTLYNIKDQSVKVQKMPDNVWTFEFSPNSSHLAVQTRKGLFLLDAKTGQTVRTFESPAANVQVVGLAFSPDGRTLVGGTHNNYRHMWDATTGRLLQSVQDNHSFSYFAQYSPNGKYLITGKSQDTPLPLWDTSTWQPLSTNRNGEAYVGGTFSSDGKLLVLASFNNIELYDFSALNPMDAQVLLNVDPQDAQLLVGGKKPKLDANGVAKVFSGVPVEVQVTKPFFKTFTTTLNLKAGETKNLNVLLERDKGTLNLTSTPRGATVWIDGEEKGKTPLKLSKFDAGEYTVTLKLNDHKEFTQRVTVQGGQDNAVNAALVLSPGIKITSKPTGAQVMIGDQVVCEKTPCTLRNLPPSIQEFTFKLDGYQTLKAKAVVPEEGTGNLDVTLKK